VSRWVLALVGIVFAIAPARAQPRPLWEIDTAANAKKVNTIQWVAFSPDGKTLLAQCEERDTDGTRERLVARDVKTHEERVLAGMSARGSLGLGWRSNAVTKTGIVLIPDGRPQMIRLKDGKGGPLRASETGAIAVWPGANDAEAVWLLNRGEKRLSIAVGTVPAIDADPNKFDPNERWTEEPLPLKEAHRFSAFTVSPDATLLAAAGCDDDTGERILALYTIASGAKLKLTQVAVVPSAHPGIITRMAFSPDGKTLATGSADSTVSLWAVAKAGKDWEPLATLPAGNFTVSTLAFSPDGRTLAAGTFDQKGRPNLYVIDVTAGKTLASHRLETAVTALAYGPEGKVLVTGDSSGRIKAWDAGALRNP
jgi:WD40 repeat protein